MTCSRQVKVVQYDWTEEETKYLLQVNKEKNIATILENINKQQQT